MHYVRLHLKLYEPQIDNLMLEIISIYFPNKSLYTLKEDECKKLRRKAGIIEFGVEREHDLALKRKPQPVGSWPDQEDDDEEDQLETSSRKRV